MSEPITLGAGLPIVNQALEPKWVRDGSSATQKAYNGALAFEDALVEQLSQSLAAAGGLSGEGAEGSGGEEGGPPGDAELASLLPQGLTSTIMSAGGLGMAAQMTRELEGVHGAAARPGGGVRAS
jgi:hypothetical protein